jgi:hypothetical protein
VCLGIFGFFGVRVCEEKEQELLLEAKMVETPKF